MPDFPAPQSLNLPLCGVDSHAHLDSPRFKDDFDAMLTRARESGIARIGHVFLRMENYLAHKEHFASIPELFFLMGIHPTDLLAVTPEEEAGMAHALATDPTLLAVGEIGLDYYWKDCPPDLQKPAFIRQLALARSLQKPVVIHCRDAFADTLAILDEQGFANYPLLWHCFGGSEEEAKAILSRGWHLSFPGPLTFPKNQALRDVAATLPLDRILVETDCPYLAPQAWRGQRNEPALTVFTAKALAEAKNMPVEEVWKITGDNARRFFGL